MQAFSAPQTSELYQSAEAGAYLEHEADFGAFARRMCVRFWTRLRSREAGADPMQALVPAHRQALAGVLVSVHGAEPELDHVEVGDSFRCEDRRSNRSSGRCGPSYRMRSGPGKRTTCWR